MSDQAADSPATRLRRFEKALATLQAGVTLTDRRRRIIYVNEAEARMHGYTVDELLGADAAVLAPEELRNPPLPPAKLKRLKSWRRESVNQRKDGSRFPVEILSDVILDGSGEPEGIVTVCHDITERKRTEAALRESEERYALAVRGANDGLWDWNLRNGEVYFSPRWRAMLGLGDGDDVGPLEQWLDRVHPEDLPELRALLDAHLAAESDHFQSEHRMLHADGSYRWMLARGVAVRDDDGAARMAGSQTDVTASKVHDPLTRLPNRALLLDRLDGALSRARRHAAGVAVLFLDLDRFKVVNDSLGHPVGDRLLIAVAGRLQECLRPGDTVARLGGDEFTILLEEVQDTRSAVSVAEGIQAALAEPFQVADHEVFVSASVGVAFSATGADRSEDMLREADTAMYHAKAGGRGRLQVFDEPMRERALSQLRLEADLRRALERGELSLVFQPILSFPDEVVTGFEALARWHHPELGLILPDDFIPVAEETGLILPIGRWVLGEACAALAGWQRRFGDRRPVAISVNLSPRQFAHPDLVQQVGEALAEAGIDPSRLELEITEQVFIDNPEPALRVLDRLREMGVGVCVDDFGTGYSSLSYLSHFRFDVLKIDRTFVHRIDLEDRQRELVGAIIELAAKLGIQVVAEGVETDGQLDRLKTMSCPYMQGFRLGKPLLADEVSALLASR